jgi:hypothetical protein
MDDRNSIRDQAMIHNILYDRGDKDMKEEPSKSDSTLPNDILQLF